jgi:hypothetical protein
MTIRARVPSFTDGTEQPQRTPMCTLNPTIAASCAASFGPLESGRGRSGANLNPAASIFHFWQNEAACSAIHTEPKPSEKASTSRAMSQGTDKSTAFPFRADIDKPILSERVHTLSDNCADYPGGLLLFRIRDMR